MENHLVVSVSIMILLSIVSNGLIDFKEEGYVSPVALLHAFAGQTRIAYEKRLTLEGTPSKQHS